jgi:hypothetical protein
MWVDGSSVRPVLPIVVLRTSGSGQRTEPTSTEVRPETDFVTRAGLKSSQRSTGAASALTTNGRCRGAGNPAGVSDEQRRQQWLFNGVESDQTPDA